MTNHSAMESLLARLREEVPGVDVDALADPRAIAAAEEADEIRVATRLLRDAINDADYPEVYEVVAPDLVYRVGQFLELVAPS